MSAAGEQSDPREADVVATAEQARGLSRPPLVVLEPLAAFLDELGIGSGPLMARAIGDGHSNVTFLLRRADDTQVVLRRPPRPPFPRSAHDVLREAKVQRAIAGHVRVPAILAVCEDDAILGVPFYIMEHVNGETVGASSADRDDRPEDCERFGTELVDALVELHSVDAQQVGLDGRARYTGYLERQVRRFAELWSANRTREVPEIDRTTRWLRDRIPVTTSSTIVHGDYRLGNVMFEPTRPVRLGAILDWEMSTLGDPLADVGYMVANWAERDDEETPMLALSVLTRQPGFLRRDDLRERYARGSGRDVEGLSWYEVLATWKAAVFLECSYARYLAGTTDDEYFATLGDGVPLLGRAAMRRIAAADRGS